jgi:hypothetical protein
VKLHVGDVLRRAKCGLVGHDVVAEYSGDQQCARRLSCQRSGCTWQHDDVEHEFDAPMPEPTESDPCRNVSTCARCGEPKFSVRHEFGDPTSDSSSACTLVSTCTRLGCSAISSTEDHHYTWSWVNPIEGEPSERWCEQRELCSSCGKPKSPWGGRRIWHDWGDWQVAPDGRAFQLCRRDGARRDKA